ncbi:MAG: GGDEF domain-containing protein [Deltaproteobacteria bacterium]|nr:GGDEF domain-containing protein [Deltaproteobacteria bacterium]
MRNRSVNGKDDRDRSLEFKKYILSEITDYNRRLTERALTLKCQAYFADVKSSLLMQTLFEFNRSKKLLIIEIEKRKKTESELIESAEKLRRLNLQLENLSLTDPLTEIFNRRKFNLDLQKELARYKRYGTPFSVIFMDIDYFKKINDDFGHVVGDCVLKDFSKLIKKNLRQIDILARWGGEEFVILSTESTKKMAMQLAEKLRAAVQKHIFEGVGSITCSFGVSQIQEKDCVEIIQKRADNALYLAKKSGRNKVCFK